MGRLTARARGWRRCKLARQRKFYVVWAGREPGIYPTWAKTEAQVKGFAGAKFKAFPTEAEARQAFFDGWEAHVGVKPHERPLPPEVDPDSICVDAACDGSPGNVEYRGVRAGSVKELFHVGPLPNGTNNLGEFLAIVHALALLHRQNDSATAVYSDSRNAINWVKARQVRSKLPRTDASAQVWSLADRALNWLLTHRYANPIHRWDTKRWGENRADFGRK